MCEECAALYGLYIHMYECVCIDTHRHTHISPIKSYCVREKASAGTKSPMPKSPRHVLSFFS